MLERLKALFSAQHRQEKIQEQLDELRRHSPAPVFWLLGKTQSGKTSLVKFLTGAEAAEIGRGFRPCTPFSREYVFPTPEAPLIRFLDTRGLGEPGYDPSEEIKRFESQAHLVLVVVKAMDHAQEPLLKFLQAIRYGRRSRPVVVAPTCLHEAYPQQQHPPYPFSDAWIRGETETAPANKPDMAGDLYRSLDAQRRRFHGLADAFVPVDLTRPEEGFHEPNYGGDRLKQVLLDLLPEVYRQTLLNLEEAKRGLQELYAGHALPYITGYSTLAASAGAFPIPWVDLLVLPAIQTQMIYHLARLYGQPLDGPRFLELAGTLGVGMAVRQAIRETMKLIPYVGSVAGGALAGASTFALGKAFCYY
jgi:uncharacterized protein (DUF697 family)